MPDTLTPAERAAIDASATHGWTFNGEPRRVQIIPRGVSGLPAPWDVPSWEAQIKAAFDLGKSIKTGMAKAKAERDAAKPRMEILPGETRRETILRLRATGRTQREVGDFLGISHVTVWKIERGKIE